MFMIGGASPLSIYPTSSAFTIVFEVDFVATESANVTELRFWETYTVALLKRGAHTKR